MIRSISLHLLVLSLSLNTCRSQEAKIPVDGYKLFWEDNFDGTTLNLEKWNYRGLDRKGDAVNKREAVSLDGKGHLLITSTTINDSVTMGMIATENIFQTLYGYFECRARLTERKGLVPAFWLQSTLNGENGTPEENGVELDVFEYFPHERVGQVSHTLHWGGYGPTHKILGPVWTVLQKATDDFHTFGLEWTPTSYTVFVDGVKTFEGSQLISHRPEFLVLSLDYIKAGSDPALKNPQPESFVVDYVRVYKK